MINLADRKGLNWAKLPNWNKNGVFIAKIGEYGWHPLARTPVFTQERNVVDDFVYNVEEE